MSAVYFHTEHEGSATLRGAERAYLSGLVSDVATALIPTHRDELVLDSLMPAVRQTYVLTHLPNGRPVPGNWPEQCRIEVLRRHVAVGWDGEGTFRGVDGKPLQSFSLLLNTAVTIGNDAMVFGARLHAQCEIHAYVEGPNRAWAADIIRQGLDAGLYRTELGWEEIETLLRSGNEHPVVTSFSVTDKFPNSHVAGWVAPEIEGEPDWDAWYEIVETEQWAMGLVALRAKSGAGLEISPANLRMKFRHEVSFFDLFWSNS